VTNNKKDLVYNQALQQFIFEGNKEDILQLHELIRMITSVPAGQRVLQDALNRATPLVISFCNGFKNKNTKGMFMWRDQAVRLVRFYTNLSKKSENMQIATRIEMADIMAHELQHYIDYPHNVWLDKNAHVVNEKILALVLCEMSAFSAGSSVECELRAQRGMPVRWMPKTAEEWKEVMAQGLSGQNRRLKGYINDCRKVLQERGIPVEQKMPSKEFYQGVTDFLKRMNISMSFTEAMSCVGQSQKLLPTVTRSKTRLDR